jgi:predicted O-methyltransferase YrrM
MSKVKEKIEELELLRSEWNIEREAIECVMNSVDLMEDVRILEIGSYNGYSALWLSLVAERVVTIEIEENRFNESRKNLEVANNVEVKLGDAVKIISELNEKFNVVLIDGLKKEYCDYLRAVLNVVDGDFRIFVDNTISHKDKMKDFFEFLNSREDLEWKETGIGKGLVVVKKKIV